jgi:hypothetical protein
MDRRLFVQDGVGDQFADDEQEHVEQRWQLPVTHRGLDQPPGCAGRAGTGAQVCAMVLNRLSWSIGVVVASQGLLPSRRSRHDVRGVAPRCPVGAPTRWAQDSRRLNVLATIGRTYRRWRVAGTLASGLVPGHPRGRRLQSELSGYAMLSVPGPARAKRSAGSGMLMSGRLASPGRSGAARNALQVRTHVRRGLGVR